MEGFVPMPLFQDHYIPKDSRPAGLSFILNKLDENAPLNEYRAVSNRMVKNNIQCDGKWKIHSHTYWPGDDIYFHLVFSLKYETINLLVLKKIFEKIKPSELVPFIIQSPGSSYSRKIWFLYEWLTDKELEIEEVKGVTFVKLLDEEKYFTLAGINSTRHKVINNMIGIKNFCFIVNKSEKLLQFTQENLKDKTIKLISSTDKRLIARAASFLLLADTRATYEIEGERAPQNRLERWAKVILEAGKNPLTILEIERLHKILLKDDRFSKMGIRDTEVFLGDRDHDNYPRPEFIGAKQTDLSELMALWLKLNQKLKESNLDPILQAVIIAFSFIYIHPLQDGNGRLHRYLFHHVLAERHFTPKGVIFPVSSVIFDQIEKYKESLTNFSSPLLEYIQWNSDEKLNVKILNHTRELYQYYNLTENAEFFYEVVKQTIEINLPNELQQLIMYDQAHKEISNSIDMPEDQLTLLINVIKDNNFELSKAKKNKFFNQLTDSEISEIENIIKEAYKLA
jgi:Fic family protein